MKGMITEIQRFSLHDGPGIRTTVFLKGCNLHCGWCHNPETISGKKELHFYPQNCIRCYKCVAVCPSKAHKKIGGEHRLFRNLCIQCGKCAAVCYAQALQMSGQLMTVDEVMAEIVQDKAFYLDSGGGVTISGGEALFQKDFVLALAAACRQEGIPVALESNIAFPFSVIQEVLDAVDLMMCDLKIFDDEQHRKWTGTGSALILDNIRRLDASGKPYILRTPLVPGVTDSDENITAIADFVQSLKNLLYYELLNFNPLGDGKYQSLDKVNEFAQARPLPESRLRALAEIADARGFEVRVA